MGFHHKFRHKEKLKRSLGLFEVTIAGVGVILGAGIYVLLGLASGYAGNAVWMSFLIASIISIFTGLSYAELSTMFRTDASEFEYVENALGWKTAKLVGFMIILTGIVSGATVALGFSHYLNALLGTPVILTSLVLIGLLSLINFVGIKQSSNLNVVFTLIESAGLFAIILLGLSYIGSVNYLEMPQGFNGVFKATALIFFAYMGFETIVKLSEETKNPVKTIPKALILSVVLSSIIYMLVAIAAVSVVGWEVLSTAKAPLAEVANAALHLGGYSFLAIAIIALFSTSNTVLMTLVTTSRLMYGMANDGSLPKKFGAVSRATKTPWFSIIFLFVFTCLFTLIGKIETVANLNDVFLFLTFAFVNTANVVLRYKLPRAKRAFKVPLTIGRFQLISFLGLLISLIMAGYAVANVL